MKTGISVTESVPQRQSISETKSDEGAEGLRIAAGSEGDAGKDSRDFNGENARWFEFGFSIHSI